MAEQTKYEAPLSDDAFIPVDMEIDGTAENVEEQKFRKNLADDPELCKQVQDYISKYYDKFKTQRTAMEELWKTIDWMWKCGQNETVREDERTRLDRQGDDLTKTKAQKCGSTMFFKQVRSLAAQFSEVLFSKDDPWKYKTRSNPEIYGSDQEAEALVSQHNLTMRWNRQAENFKKKAIEFLFMLMKYGNVPVACRWFRRNAEVLDKWPVIPAGGGEVTYKIERRDMLCDNRLLMDVIPPQNFFADICIGDTQNQQCIIVRSSAIMTDFLSGAKVNEYLNVDSIDEDFLYKGGDDNDDLRTTQQENSGLDPTISDTNTGTFRQIDAVVLLPIDDTKKIGKRWNPKEYAPKKYWVTIVPRNGTDITGGVCLRIERNLDPDDDMPFEMVHLFPDDSSLLYHLSPAQVVRGNFSEATTSKEQMIDQRTLQSNRPLKAKRGEVFTDTGDLQFGRDKVFWVENENSLTEFNIMPVTDNANTLTYLDADSDEAIGNNRATRGEPMGQRTTSTEASNAYQAASLPHKMLMKYVFAQWLGFYARKGPRYWHVYAQDNQTIKITDEKGVYHSIKPSKLYGEYDVEITVVDDFEKDIVQQQALTWTAQNVLPLFIDVMDKREAAKLFFDTFLHTDVSRIIRPDDSDAQRADARQEDYDMTQLGKDIYPDMTDNYQIHMAQHKSWRVQFNGLESENPNVVKLDRHMAAHDILKERQGAGGGMGMGNPAAPSGNTTPGMVEGNAIAGMMGAMSPSPMTPPAQMNEGVM